MDKLEKMEALANQTSDDDEENDNEPDYDQMLEDRLEARINRYS